MKLHLSTQGLRHGRTMRSGLTLLEVIVSLAIFLMSLVAIGGLVDMGMDREMESQLTMRATRLAQSKMGDVVSGYTGLSSDSGTFTYDPDWSYNVEVSQPQQGQPTLSVVSVTVSRSFKGKSFNYVLTQFVLNTTYIGSAQPASSTTDSGSATPPAPGSTSSGGTQ